MIELEAISLKRLEQVYQPFAAKVVELQHRLDFQVRITQALRSYQEQELLFEQGRSLPGKVVTNAKPGWSWHSYGLAVDMCPLGQNTKLPDWNDKHPCWEKMIEVGEQLGLTCGALFRTFPDKPHFQLVGRFPVTPDDEVRSLYKSGGILAVWKSAFE